jgi:hypothetical protein
MQHAELTSIRRVRVHGVIPPPKRRRSTIHSRLEGVDIGFDHSSSNKAQVKVLIRLNERDVER